ncbi:chitin deacetylase [Podila humilis]|nr:chitin deacetylase [Podila humilis]
MVKLLISTFTVLVLSVTAAAVSVQTPAAAPATGAPFTGYPAANAIPDINSPEVQAWLKEIDLTDAPTTPLHKGDPPPCPNPPIPDECYWTCDGCAGDDITACGTPNTWGLTYDDGPSTDTPVLLDYLKTQKVSATFFLIGSNVVQYPEIVKREVAEGHHLASHTWSHHALTTLTNEQIVAEMKWTEKAVMEATGLRMKYMRPPYGDINKRVRIVLKKLGYIPVDWTGDEFDTNDWQMPTMSESTVISTFTKSLDAYVASPKTKGFYCLEHDLNSMTVGVAQKLIPLGQARNITISSVAQCERDAMPYQSGSTSPIPTVSGVTPTAASTSGTSTATGTATVTNPSGTPTNKPSGAVALRASVFSLAGAAVAAVALMM